MMSRFRQFSTKMLDALAFSTMVLGAAASNRPAEADADLGPAQCNCQGYVSKDLPKTCKPVTVNECLSLSCVYNGLAVFCDTD